MCLQNFTYKEQFHSKIPLNKRFPIIRKRSEILLLFLTEYAQPLDQIFKAVPSDDLSMPR
jgi:hypothetical protein